MNNDSILSIGIVIFAGWAVITEYRMHRLESELATARESKADADVEKKNHVLSDIELDALLMEKLGGTKPPPK